MGLYLVGTPLLFIGIWFIHLVVRNRQKDRRIADNEERIKQLERLVEGMKSRHLTAKGGLSREDKLKLLDLLGKIGMLKDDASLVNTRIEDLEREVIRIMNKGKTGDKL